MASTLFPAESQRNALPSFLFLTSGQADTCGLLPLIVQRGFNGKIYGTRETLTEVELTLRELALMSAEYCQWLCEYGPRLGLQVSDPLYSIIDVEHAAKQFCCVEEGDTFSPHDSIQATIRRLHKSHMDILNIEARTESDSTVVFSPLPLKGESTAQIHPRGAKENCLLLVDCSKKEVNEGKTITAISSTLKDEGKVLIAVDSASDYGRVFEFLYREMNSIDGLGVPVYFDSHVAREVLDVLSQGPIADSFMKDVIPCSTKNESMKINGLTGSAIIVSSILPQSNGRMAHHLKHHLWEENNLVVLWGNVPDGTISGQLLDYEKNLWLFGARVIANCNVCAPSEGPVVLGHGSHHDDHFIAPDFFRKFACVIPAFDTESNLFDYEEDIEKSHGHPYVPLKGDSICLSGGTLKHLRTVYEEPLCFTSTVENDLSIEIGNLKRSIEEAGESLNNLTGELQLWAESREDALEAVAGCSRIIEIIIETMSSMGTEGIANAEQAIESLSNRLSHEEGLNNSEALAALNMVRSTLTDR